MLVLLKNLHLLLNSLTLCSQIAIQVGRYIVTMMGTGVILAVGFQLSGKHKQLYREKLVPLHLLCGRYFLKGINLSNQIFHIMKQEFCAYLMKAEICR